MLFESRDSREYSVMKIYWARRTSEVRVVEQAWCKNILLITKKIGKTRHDNPRANCNKKNGVREFLPTKGIAQE